MATPEEVGQTAKTATQHVTELTNAIGQLTALGKTVNEQVDGISNASTQLKKSFDDITNATMASLGAVDNLLGSVGGAPGVLGSFAGGLNQALGIMKDAAGAVSNLGFSITEVFDNPSEPMREFDKAIFSVNKRFGESIKVAQEFGDSLKLQTSGDFEKSLRLTRNELTRFYQQTAATNLTQKQLSETVTTASGDTNLLAASFVFAESAAISSGQAITILNNIINKQGVSASEAADMLGLYSGVAKDVGIAIGDVASTLNSAVSSFTKLGFSADFGAPILQGFGRVVKDVGLGIDEAKDLTLSLSSALANLSNDYGKAYLMFQRGGLDFGGGAGVLGASIGLQATMLEAEETGDQAKIGEQLVGAMRDTLASFTGGQIVTVKEARDSPELQTQFYTQQQLLKTQFGLGSDAAATRTLELLAKIDEATRSGDMDTKKELEEQIRNEQEGRDQTLGVLEKIDRRLEVMGNLLAIEARDEFQKMQKIGEGLAEAYVMPVIEEGGKRARSIFEGDKLSGAGKILDILGAKMPGELPQLPGLAARSGPNIPEIERAFQEATPNTTLTPTQLAAVAKVYQSESSGVTDENQLKQIVEQSLASTLGSSNVNVTISFANPDMQNLIQASAQVGRDVAGS